MRRINHYYSELTEIGKKFRELEFDDTADAIGEYLVGFHAHMQDRSVDIDLAKELEAKYEYYNHMLILMTRSFTVNHDKLHLLLGDDGDE